MEAQWNSVVCIVQSDYVSAQEANVIYNTQMRYENFPGADQLRRELEMQISDTMVSWRAQMGTGDLRTAIYTVHVFVIGFKVVHPAV